MAGQRLEVSYEHLKRIAAQVDDKADTYNSEYTALYKTVDQLRTYFDGVEYQQFVANLRNFQNDFQNMEKMMREYAEFLRKAADTYRQEQERQKAEASRLPTGN